MIAAGDQLAIADTSASLTKKVTPDGLVTAGLRLMPASSIPVAKVDLTGIALPPGSVTSTEIADGHVTTAKINAGAVTDDKIAGVGLNKLPVAPAKQVLAGPITGASAAPTYRALAGSDLPAATATVLGAVSVPAAGGLVASGTGELAIGNSVVAGTNPVVTYDAKGLITSGRALQGTDLPVATAAYLGGVKQGDGITISGDGTISQSVTGVTAGTYTKVTTDVRGNITAGSGLTLADLPTLTAAQIPDIDASKITSGTFSAGLIGPNTISREALQDYAISYIQEATPAATGVAIGTMWFQESTAGLHMWNGNSWMPISIGRLSQENLRYCGTVDASSGLVTGVTTFGVSAGYKIGDTLKAATDQATGVYFVVATPGSSIPQTPGITYDNGDWVLCNGSAAGWVRIDTLSGGGGGGGASHLGDLLDVTLTGPTEDQLLSYSATGQWVNVTALDEGTYS